jgi:hypothetical protein
MLPLDVPRAEVFAVPVGLDTGTLLGKRYADAAGTVEVLCTKAGRGTLSWAGETLVQRSARPLPASD